eukprot:scaffold6003_cov92-Cylindrotheca_fusiformis.AAC.1
MSIPSPAVAIDSILQESHRGAGIDMDSTSIVGHFISTHITLPPCRIKLYIIDSITLSVAITAEALLISAALNNQRLSLSLSLVYYPPHNENDEIGSRIYYTWRLMSRIRALSSGSRHESDDAIVLILIVLTVARGLHQPT